MDTMTCNHCGEDFPLGEEKIGAKIYCPHCKKYLYTVDSPPVNKYSAQNPYHCDKPNERTGHP